MAERTCSVDGCDTRSKARGMCNVHYLRWFKKGHTGLDPQQSVQERFWSKVNKNGPVPEIHPDLGACWIWFGAITGGGYGNFALSKTDYRPAHRFAYEMLAASVSPELEMDHLCRVRSCVNPSHLEPVPQVVNTWRGLAPEIHNWLTTHCPQNHLYDEANTYWYGGNRKCRECRRAAVRRHEAKRRAAKR